MGSGGTGVGFIDNNIKGITDLVTDTLRTSANVATLGQSKNLGIDQMIKSGTGELTGANAMEREEAEKAAAAQQEQMLVTQEAEQAERQKEAEAQKESEIDRRRQELGSRSRTLLTGSEGVDEDEENLTRRTLGAF